MADDGYFNQSKDPHAWETHPVTSSNLSESDVKKSESELGKFLERNRWDVRFTSRSNLRRFRNAVQSTLYDEIARSADYQSYLTGSNIRFYVLEHFIFACWKNCPNSETDPTTGVAYGYSIPWRPPESHNDPSTETARAVPQNSHLRYNTLLLQYSGYSPTPGMGTTINELFSPVVQPEVARCIRQRHPRDPDCDKMRLVLEPLPKHKNQGYYRLDLDRIIPVDASFQRNAMLSESEYQVYTRVVGKDLLTFTEQDHVRREELPGFAFLQRQHLSRLPNAIQFVLERTMLALPEAEDTRIKEIKRKWEPMVAAFDPDQDPIDHLISGGLLVNATLRRYAASDDMIIDESVILDKIHDTLDPLFGSLPEDRLTPYNRDIEEYMRNYLRRDDVDFIRTVPDAHKNAFTSIHALLQLMRDIYAKHKPRHLRHDPREVYKVHISDEPVLAPRGHTALLLDAPSYDAPGVSESKDEFLMGRFDKHPMAQSVASKGGTPWKQNLSYFEDTRSRRGGERLFVRLESRSCSRCRSQKRLAIC